ncbi:xanthine dehydrogenase family protein molybdopterin-binding subunit [Streptomyces albus]|uniref:xanthine dehydrogenase family protein molybdopterin-binding subunit n=1 Tax=Streptomyces sp. NRRL F-5917 TaxID=1463873 RepID=UPI0006908096|nr:xanthine dehydrogenase family protein molybdopterin-binding subunit [Streptomyces sp. NRRL F-5917]
MSAPTVAPSSTAARPAPPGPDAGLRRPDGLAKLTGAARYTGDLPLEGSAVGTLVCATVPRADRAVVHADEARAADGVVAVLTAADMPRLHPSPLLGTTVMPLQDERVRYEGQPVALVLAESVEQARYAASLVRVSYEGLRAATGFDDAEDAVESAPSMSPTDEERGEVEAGLAAARHRVTRTYTTADRHHSPIEPSVTHARWDGDSLTLYDSVQGISLARTALAEVLGIDPGQIRVVCPYIGGGFGCKGYVWPHQYLTAAAARVVGRGVRLPLTRAQMFTSCGHQPTTRQTVTLGADAEGRLTAVEHHSVNAASRDDEYGEDATAASGWMYATPALRLRRRIRHTDRAHPTPMRAPHEGPGMFALESALDELAHEAGIDPVELRLRNEPDREPLTGRPFSSREQRACLLRGAELFGWRERDPRTGSMHDGDELVGWGMAAATMDTYRSASTARVRHTADGRTVVETGTQEIGTGQPGVIATIVSEVLGVPPATVEVRIGDTRLPAAAMTAGSSATGSVGSAVHAAATEVRDRLAAGAAEAEATGSWAPQEGSDGLGRHPEVAIHTYGAVFAEVRVDALLGTVRVRRVTGVYSAGRIINPRTARSQMTGGIIWGLGQALLEDSRFDARHGRFRSKNLAGYAVPVNADVPDIDVSFVDEVDHHASALGSKGIGELGAVGVSAAVANAVFHATGVRVRDLPIGVPDLLPGLAPAAH